jgi:hypothetical protein
MSVPTKGQGGPSQAFCGCIWHAMQEKQERGEKRVKAATFAGSFGFREAHHDELFPPPPRFGDTHAGIGCKATEPAMTTAVQPAGGAGSPSSSSLADVIDTILDKGLVIDAYIRVSIVGIELLTIDARVVVASVDTYLRFAEAVNRLDIAKEDPKADLPGIIGDASQGVSQRATEGVAKHKTKGALDSAGEKLSDMLTGAQPQRTKSRQRRKSS